MKIAVYSNVSSARQGGGVLYIASLAAALAQKNEVELFFPTQIDNAELERLLPPSFAGIQTRQIDDQTRLSLVGEIKGVLSKTKYDLVVTQSTQISRLKHGAKSVLVCEFPLQKTARLSEKGRLRIFHKVIANSSFTSEWIHRRWGRKAEVLHPAVFQVAPLTKEPWILAVGRFVAGRRSKNQLEMVQMFRELVDAGLVGWQFHLAGTVQDEEYCERVRAMAEGLPVVLHLDISRSDLEQLYGQSSIFWHSAGAQCDPEAEPECMEHFGIATAEAMSAGAVPVVINRGGQPEILGASESGILWNTFDECKDETWKLIHDQARLGEMSRRAVERARAFSFPGFANRVTEIFEGT
ncbi:MAG TPA: glycosyltransferase family 4 protein [Pyrinomonadaceae bacterium]|nr:glycosyltransferase family 4 protein [Pyrinomonadaceae bacterium]